MNSDEIEKMQNNIVDLESLVRELRFSEAHTLKANSTSISSANTTQENTTNSTDSSTNNTSTNNTNTTPNNNTDPIVPTPPVDPYENITLNFNDVNWANVTGKVSPV
jgi:hypothetical protein